MFTESFAPLGKTHKLHTTRCIQIVKQILLYVINAFLDKGKSRITRFIVMSDVNQYISFCTDIAKNDITYCISLNAAFTTRSEWHILNQNDYWIQYFIV